MTLRTSTARLLGVLCVTSLCSACASTPTTPAIAKSAGVKVNPAAVQALAAAPNPPANATKRTFIGKDEAAVRTSSAAGDTDSYWVVEIDIDGDGIAEQTGLLWDDEDKVLFAYSDTDAPCISGGMAVVSILVGVYGKDNSHRMPEGSGFYAVYLDATECGIDATGLYGCKFDASGTVTACGEAVVDEAGDTLTITAGQ